MHIVLITGGFDPVHRGHIDYMRDAKQIGDFLIVGLNSDNWLKAKKGTNFMSFDHRKKIIESIKYVDKVISFDDSDGSAYDAIMQVKALYPDNKISVANGGDRKESNAPAKELSVNNVNYVWGIGGPKTDSSSSILKKYVESYNDTL